MIDPLEEFMRRDPSQKGLVEGVIGEGELTMLFGESGVGKSFVALDLALSIASAQPWLGRNVTQGSVVYLPSEGFDGFHARIQAWCAHRGVSSAELPFHMGAYEFALNNPHDFKEFQDELCGIHPQPKLIVVDTLTGMTSGLDQNSAKDMAAFADTCKMMKLITTGAAVLVVHHSGHKEKGRGKGALDFHAACDKVIAVRRSGRDGTLAIRCTKNRHGKPFDDVHVRLEDCGPSAVLVEADKPAKRQSKPLSRGDQIFGEVVGEKPIAEDEARERFYERYAGTPGAKRNAWSRSLKKAVAAGLVEIDSNGLIKPRTHTPHNEAHTASATPSTT